ncbi:MAG: tyrosine recombinase [Chloroflexi bacterium]|nr:tyrosine recombinase [Chloroflexota bacterium]
MTKSTASLPDPWIRLFLDYLLVYRNSSPHTISAYAHDLGQLYHFLEEQEPSFPEEGWAAVTGEMLIAFQEFLHKMGYASTTITRKVAAVRTFFEYLRMEEVISRNPARVLETPRPKVPLPKAVSERDVERLLAAPLQEEGPRAVRDRALLELLYATGMRVSEVAQLRLSDVNLERNTLLCRGKRNREREVPFHEVAAQALLAYLRDARPQLINPRRPTDAFFLNARGGPLTRQGIWLIIQRHVRAAGIEAHITPHVLRHSIATHLLRRGANLREVQELLGHVTLTTTQRYTRVINEHLRDVYDAVHPRSR